jgi:hypothetical protein
MNPLAPLFRFLGGQARGGNRATIYYAMATSGYRVLRRIVTTKQRTLLRFEVKPGEVYELRGVRRGR